MGMIYSFCETQEKINSANQSNDRYQDNKCCPEDAHALQDKLYTLLFLVREREPSVSPAGGFPAVIHQKQKVC